MLDLTRIPEDMRWGVLSRVLMNKESLFEGSGTWGTDFVLHHGFRQDGSSVLAVAAPPTEAALQAALTRGRALTGPRAHELWLLPGIFWREEDYAPARAFHRRLMLSEIERGERLPRRLVPTGEFTRWVEQDAQQVIALSPWAEPHDALGAIAGDQALARLLPALRAFLEAELVADQFPLLAASADRERAIPLARVFVDLPDTFGRPIMAHLLATSDRRAGLRDDEVRSDESADAPRPRHLTLIGGPGQGKTTLVQQLCQVLRAALIEPQAAPRDDLTEVALRGVMATRQTIDRRCRRLPFRIDLRRYAAAREQGVQTVEDYLWSRIETRVPALSRDAENGRSRPTPADLRRLLGTWPTLVVFDGFDEVASESRPTMLGEIERFLDAHHNADLLAVLTTRPQVGLEVDTRRFAPIELAPLPRERAEAYARGLLQQRYRHDPERAEELLGRVRDAIQAPGSAELCRSPLQMGVVTTLVERRGAPPQEQWRLYGEYYRVLYERERERGLPHAREILEKHETLVGHLHWDAGYQLHLAAERGSGAGVGLSRATLRSLVRARLDGDGVALEASKELADRVVDVALDRLVLLAGLRDQEVGFEIRPLQEYAAARRLMEDEEAMLVPLFRAIAVSAHWQNVASMLAGGVGLERRHLREALVAAVVEDAGRDEVGRETGHWAELALRILEEGLVRQYPRGEAALVGLTMGALEGLGHPRLFQLAPRLEAVAGARVKEAIQKDLRRPVWEAVGAWTAWMGLGGTVELPQDTNAAIAVLELQVRLGVARADEASARVFWASVPAGVEAAWWPEPWRRWRNAANQEQVPLTLPFWSAARVTWRPIRSEARHPTVPADASPVWAIHRAIARFELDPSKEGLAAAMDLAVNPGFDHELSAVPSGWRNAAPWPLAVLLAFRERWPELRPRVLAGDFGDTGVWEQAEHVARAPWEGEWPVNMSDVPLALGRQALVASWEWLPVGIGWNTEQTDHQDAAAFWDIWRRSGVLTRGRLCFLGQFLLPPAADDPVWPQVVEAARSGDPILLIRGAKRDNFLPPWPERLAALGAAKGLFVGTTFGEALMLVRRHPELPGLLPFAAALGGESGLLEDYHPPDPASLDATALAAVALLLHLQRQDLTEAESDQLAVQALALATTEKHIIQQAQRILRRGRRRVLLPFAQRLCAGVRPRHFLTRLDLHGTIAAIHGSRSSGLTALPDFQPAGWPVGPHLDALHLRNTGPIADTELTFGRGINLITGDNGLGKTFLLDITWWTLTGAWPQTPQVERNGQGDPIRTRDIERIAEPKRSIHGERALNAEIKLTSGDETVTCTYDFQSARWLADRRSASPPAVVIYARADGGCSVFDPLRNRPEPLLARDPTQKERPSAFQYGPDEWVHGGGNAMSGLISHLRDWQQGDGERSRLFWKVVGRLSAGSGEVLEPGPLVVYQGFDKRVPTLKMPYGAVPLPLVSSGVRRILTLAFVLVWTWDEHLRAAELGRLQPCTHLVLLLDELELHLHPQWQRAILPALLEVLRELSPRPEAQVFVATHSPLVLASVEVGLDEDYDRLLHVELNEGRVRSVDLGAFKRGDVLNWLTSEAFGLTQVRSLEAERAIEAAEAWMRGDTSAVPDAWRDSAILHAELVRVLPGDDHFWPRWILTHRKVRP